MIESLEKQHTITGMSKEGIIALLGEPGDLGKKSNEELEYFIKSGSFLRYEVYVIAFQDNAAIKYWRTEYD